MARPDSPSNDEPRGMQPNRLLSRRTAIGVTGTALMAAVAGCSSAGGERTGDPTLVDETATVAPGSYDSIEFALDQEAYLTLSATLTDRSVEIKHDGPAVDVVVMTPAHYEAFQRGETFEYVGGISMPDVVSGEVSSSLDSGDYRLVVDNSARGAGEPGDSDTPAVVDLAVSAPTSGREETAGIRP